MVIEYRANDNWQKVELKPGQDFPLKCDRIRISTNRSDNATITVEMPVQLGKKYRLLWNDASGIWDFASAS